MTQNFIWYELLTPDAQASRAFYEAVIGWRVEEQPSGPMDYRMIASPEGLTGGMMTITPDMAAGGARPVWLGYISVADVDACVSDIVADGGAVHLPAFDIENVGRLAMVADPSGAVFYVMRGASPEPSHAFAPHVLGRGGWNELHARDGAAAMAFYKKHFGWSESRAVDMGPMGTYYVFQTGDGVDTGGVMTDSNFPVPAWLYYFNTDDIDAAKTRVEAAGGTVILGPMEVPGPMMVLTAIDPHGAMFALVAPKT